MILQGRAASATLAALVVSLALNLFAGGLLAGRGLRPEPAPPAAPQDGPPLIRALGPLPPELRRSLREELRSERDELGPIFRRLREARRLSFELLRAPELDADRLRAVFADMRAAGEAAQLKVQEALIAAAQDTPAKTRAGWRPIEREEHGR